MEGDTEGCGLLAVGRDTGKAGELQRGYRARHVGVGARMDRRLGEADRQVQAEAGPQNVDGPLM